MTATTRLFSRGAYPLGAAAGGFIAKWLGLPAAFWFGASIVAVLFAVYFIPLVLKVDLSHDH